MIDIHQVDILMCAWIVNSKFDPTVLVDTETLTTSHSLLCWTIFFADISAIFNSGTAAEGDHQVQILMGELSENLDKVDTTLQTGTYFLSYNTFITLLANVIGIIGSFYQCSTIDIDTPMNPLMFLFAYHVAFELSSDDSHTWLKNSSA
jgi:hypothetical protein